MKFLSIAFVVLFSAALVAAQEKADQAEVESTAPPADVTIEPPAETLPTPVGEREGRLELGREVDLGQLRKQIGPEGRRFLHRSGDRGLSFGLDMAERGISFGLRFAHGQAGPADARAFGIDMGRRGKAFGLEMRDRSIDAVERATDDSGAIAPRDGRDARFNETPGDITIDAPPIPLGADTPRPRAEDKVIGRDILDREVRFRREF